uniref:Uncharacterized protein n=1 Tax=Rhizophora mucronata TaxID=61149 RepID=A0A2P2MZK0_RHIMU
MKRQNDYLRCFPRTGSYK